MRAAGQLAGLVLQELRNLVEVGVTTLEIDRAAEKMITDAGALPTFKGYHGFPYSICASVNEQVVHGFPSDYKLKDGDIFSIDCGATLEGFVGDTATTVPVGTVSEERLQLVVLLKNVLSEQFRNAVRVSISGTSAPRYSNMPRGQGYSVVRDYVGHGIGRRMHEDPQIPNYGKPGQGPKIKAGYVFAVEPMINLGSHHTKVLADGWTVVTLDGKPSAHVEHTIAITEEGPGSADQSRRPQSPLRAAFAGTS